MTSPYSYTSPQSTCKHCGGRIIKLSLAHDDSFWRHEHNDAARCPSGKTGVKLETFATPVDEWKVANEICPKCGSSLADRQVLPCLLTSCPMQYTLVADEILFCIFPRLPEETPECNYAETREGFRLQVEMILKSSGAVSTPRCPKCGGSEIELDRFASRIGAIWVNCPRGHGFGLKQLADFAQFFHPAPSPPQKCPDCGHKNHAGVSCLESDSCGCGQ